MELNSYKQFGKILILGSLLLSVSSCQEKTIASKPIGIDPSMDNLKFKTGTFWIYRDDLGSNFDTITVKSTSNGTYSPGKGFGEYDYYNINLFSSLIQTNFNDFISTSLIRRNTDFGGYKGQPIFSQNLASGTLFNGLSIIEELEEMQIGSKTFTSVKHFHIDKEEQAQPHQFQTDMDLYFANDIGLIKMVSSQNDTIKASFSIIDYSIFH